MRSREGQLSDNRPIKRTVDEKRRQLRELEEDLRRMKPSVSEALKTSIKTKIRELRSELGAA